MKDFMFIYKIKNYVHLFYKIKKILTVFAYKKLYIWGTTEMGQSLKALTYLPKDEDFISSTHMTAHS